MPTKTKRAKPLSSVGTKRWRQDVPIHLQEPFGKALAAMEANDVVQACWWFGETMNHCQNEHEAKPVMFFGAQVAGQRYLELRGAAPDHKDLPEWKTITRQILEGGVEAFPDDAVARHNLGRFLQDTYDIEGAKAAYRHTLLMDSSMVETWANLGTLLYEQGDKQTAVECWERAISLPADKASGRLSQSYYWLRTGQYEKGWTAFNDRWKDPVFVRNYGRDAELGGIHWQGEKLLKRHKLFLHGEQGLGDHIQFARFIPSLRERGIQIAGLETRGILKRWMEASFPDVPVFVRDEDARPAFTHHCSTMDLPGLLGTTTETVPPPIAPQMPADDHLFNKSMRRTVASFATQDIRVGIAWEGAKGNTADAMRSIPHEQLRHLADIPGVTWVNLQFADNAAIVGRSWLGANFVDGTEGCTDALDTAAVIRGLDLVVTVDTATLHVAGTVGVPVIGLHRYCREWRWLDSGESSPWYPSALVWSVPAPNAWEPLLREVRHHLTKLTNA